MTPGVTIRKGLANPMTYGQGSHVVTTQRRILTDNVIRLAKAKGIGPTAIAEATGMSRPWASMVLSAQRNVTIEQVPALAKLLRVSRDSLTHLPDAIELTPPTHEKISSRRSKSRDKKTATPDLKAGSHVPPASKSDPRLGEERSTSSAYHGALAEVARMVSEAAAVAKEADTKAHEAALKARDTATLASRILAAIESVDPDAVRGPDHRGDRGSDARKQVKKGA